MLNSIRSDVSLLNRRHWLKAAGALTAAATLRPLGAAERLGIAEAKAKKSPGMQIGILMGTFGGPTLEARLDAVKACGLGCAQLSMGCAGLPAMPDVIPSELVERIRREAAARGITIVSLEGTFNMSHPDAAHRQTGLRQLRVMAKACRELGTSKIHICTGTRDRQSMWRRHADNNSPEAWRDLVSCAREATAIAREAEVVLAFEPEVNNVVDSALKSRRLMDEVGSPHLKVTMDAANIFHTGELARMSEILDEAFALIGRDIVLAHAKDLSHDGDAGHEPAGHGKLDYDRYLALLAKYGFQGPILLHGLSAEQVPGCVAFLRKKLARIEKASAKSSP